MASKLPSVVLAKPWKKPCTPSNTVRGPENPARASSAARMPDCAAQPACMRLVQVPSARYSMMPDAIEPTTPSASTSCAFFQPSALATAAAAPMAPNTAVGWKPALCTIFGATRPSRHISSTPTAMPSSAALPSSLVRSPIASTAGTITAPAWTGPPSKVSSKSSPWAAVPLLNAAPAALTARLWPIAVQGPSSSQPASALPT